jgi:hypothetical protein
VEARPPQFLTIPLPTLPVTVRLILIGNEALRFPAREASRCGSEGAASCAAPILSPLAYRDLVDVTIDVEVTIYGDKNGAEFLVAVRRPFKYSSFMGE